MSLTANDWLKKIRELPLPEKIKVINVCGGHERAITTAGLRSALPEAIELIPGPGCPVCICPEEDIYMAIQLALHESVILVAFGDMLRVPVNVAKGEIRSLQQAKAAGADIRPIASPLEALHIAQHHPDQAVVFFAAGFETTMAPVAALLVQGIPENLSILLSGRLTWPAVDMLLRTGQATFDGVIAPGHVATVMGAEEWTFIVEKYGLPAAVAGFTPVSLLAALYSVLRQHVEGRLFLDNCYPELVSAHGNKTAHTHLHHVFTVTAAMWRGIGIIADSGFSLREARYDARWRFPDCATNASNRKRAGEMPAGCDCARVVLGQIYPDGCRLYGTACTPRSPVGPCMVSDEGACRIWWSVGIRSTAPTAQPAEITPELSIGRE
ncbi:hydrogenase formation protein HypD [Thioflexithrix psekupsensis]|uniref:Hydrogenase maturation factor n=1 Tax=Thioflexithrix psekupsensis TaxID=1570016 RepID=A0A251X7R2_9GAMM|nr:hydrogenase formation protein HypD [Thioflexithrix psekupsensis]OUD13767.1 hydrogenase formation protein HypD [Thioflexithrix psekupsensis]